MPRISRVVGVAKKSERLVARLRAEGFIREDASVKFERCYPGYWQRSAGAWSWTVYGDGVDIGSTETVTRLLKAKQLGWGVNGSIEIEKE